MSNNNEDKNATFLDNSEGKLVDEQFVVVDGKPEATTSVQNNELGKGTFSAESMKRASNWRTTKTEVLVNENIPAEQADCLFVIDRKIKVRDIPLQPVEAGKAFALAPVFTLGASGVMILLFIFFALFGLATSLNLEDAISFVMDNILVISAISSQLCLLVFVCFFSKSHKCRAEDIGFRKTSTKYYLIALLVVFGCYFGLSILDTWLSKFFELIGYGSGTMGEEVSWGTYLLLLPVITIIPAVVEEIIFRGFILEGMKECGIVACCLINALFFMLIHQNPEQTIYQFVLGAVITLVAIRSNSIYPAMLIHFLNNLLAYVVPTLFFQTPLWLILVGFVVAIGVLVYLIFFDKLNNPQKKKPLKAVMKYGKIGIIICVIGTVLTALTVILSTMFQVIV